MGWEAKVRYPRNIGMALEELGERQCVFTMSLPSEGERLETLQKQESGKGVKRRP